MRREEWGMMSEKTRRTAYGPAFQAKVGLEAIRGMKTINEIAQDDGVHPAQLGQWKKKILERAGSLFEGKRGPKGCTVDRAPIVPGPIDGRRDHP